MSRHRVTIMNNLEALTYAIDLCARHEAQTMAREAATAGLVLRELRDFMHALEDILPDYFTP